jgi:predicted nicotinamide N-methyase
MTFIAGMYSTSPVHFLSYSTRVMILFFSSSLLASSWTLEENGLLERGLADSLVDPFTDLAMAMLVLNPAQQLTKNNGFSPRRSIKSKPYRISGGVIGDIAVAEKPTASEQLREWLLEKYGDRVEVVASAAGKTQVIELPDISREITIKQSNATLSEECGGQIWNSGRVLANVLSSWDLQGKTVLELGSGTGIGALSAASYGAASVTATDCVDATLQLIEANADLNQLDVEVQRLCWGDAHDINALRTDYDIILAADVTYLGSNIAALLETVVALSREGHTEFLLTYTRKAPEDDEVTNTFLKGLEEYFETVSHKPHGAGSYEVQMVRRR